MKKSKTIHSVGCTKSKRQKPIAEEKPNWNKFDSIWSISFTGYPERKSSLEKEFKRIGILDSSNFSWRYTFPTIFDNILFDVTKNNINRNYTRSVNSMSCSLGHYSCIKTAYELGHKFSLFIEDDVRFLKDVSLISKILNDIPPCADVINLDPLPCEHSKDEYQLDIKDLSYNDSFFTPSKYVWGASCYALSRNAMKAIITRYEQELHVSDEYTSGKIFLGKDITYYSAKTNVCCQVMFSKSNNIDFGNDIPLHAQYKKCNLDYSKYNIFDIDGYDYGKVITA